MMASRFSRGACLGAAVFLLAACKNSNPVGEGTGPTDLWIRSGISTSGVQIIECGTTVLQAIARFEGDHDSQSDVSSRVIWTSSNPGVIDVSNGDLETYPGSGSYFPVGTVVARTTGVATIRASYGDGALTASFGIDAKPIKGMRIWPELTRMAPNSQAKFFLYVDPENDALEQDLTGSAVWSIPSSSPAGYITSGSTVQGSTNPLDTPFTLEARLYTCDQKITRTISLGKVSGLNLSYEQPTGAKVPLGIDDRVRVDAVFEDASAIPQNLSSQLVIKNADGYDPDIASTSTATATTTVTSGSTAQLGANDYLLIGGLQDKKPVKLQLTYDKSGLNLVALTREYTFTDIDVTSLRVDPASVDLTFPDLGQLSAYATFQDGIERPFTRFVTWSTEYVDLLSSVGANGINGGLLTPLNVGGEAKVFATYTSDIAGKLEERAIVNVHHN